MVNSAIVQTLVQRYIRWPSVCVWPEVSRLHQQLHQQQWPPSFRWNSLTTECAALSSELRFSDSRTSNEFKMFTFAARSCYVKSAAYMYVVVRRRYILALLWLFSWMSLSCIVIGRSGYRIWIGNRTKAFEWYHFQWPWVISNDLAKYPMTQSIARLLCDSWASRSRSLRSRLLCAVECLCITRELITASLPCTYRIL